MKLFTYIKTNLLFTLVWGCMYVPDTKIQDGQQIPKWNFWSYLGQFLEFFDTHHSLVVKIHHISTGYISLHYHLVIDCLFEMIWVLAMMPCLMMSVINSLTNSPSMNPMYIVGLLLINYEVWLSKPGVFTLELKGCCCLAEDCGCVSGLIKLLKSLLTPF